MNPIAIRNEKAGQKICEALKRRHFDAYYCSNKEEAKKLALSLIPQNDTVCWGGSVTLEQIGLLDAIRTSELYHILDRDTAHTPEERQAMMRQGLLADTFLMSSNAISEDGQLVNIDGVGNRVAALTFGPKNVIIVVGMNKVVKTVQDAYTRAHTLAAPINIQRFEHLQTPCKNTGTCHDCIQEDCICCSVVTTRVCRPAGKIKVILVGENLGF